MIRIKKSSRPLELTDQLVFELTDEYKNRQISLEKPFIEDALLESSHSKCAYCECKLNIESKYMEVEHYHDKSSFPDQVVAWDNLLPSCKRCNGRKHGHNTVKDPIINPATMDPKEHLLMKYYRLHAKTIVGKETIEVLMLNDTSKVVKKRFEISQLVHEKIEELCEKCKTFSSGEKTTRLRNRIVQTTKNILEEASPQAEYAASVATDIMCDSNFTEVVDILKSEGLWDQELDNLFKVASTLSLL